MASVSEQLYTTPEVLSEIFAGEGMLPGELARHAPPSRIGKRGVAARAVTRWMLSGVKGPSGFVRLEAAYSAGRPMSTKGALARFLAAQNAVPAGSPSTVTAPRVTPASVSEELAKAGI